MLLEPCEKRAAHVSSAALVRYRGNDYSVPTAFGFQDVIVKGFVSAVERTARSKLRIVIGGPRACCHCQGSDSPLMSIKVARDRKRYANVWKGSLP
jgi:hypothetical protein